MSRARRPVRQFILAVLAQVFVSSIRLLPLPWARAVGRVTGRIALALLPRLHKVGRANLDLAYGDSISPEEKQRILRGAAENMGIIAVEFPFLKTFSPEKVRTLARIEGWEQVNPDIGFLAMGSHLGNWEWVGPLIHHFGFKTAEVVRYMDSPRLNRLVDDIRRSGGVVTIGKDDAGGEITRLLREGWFVGVLVDQSPRNNAVPTTFFGQPCWSTIAPVMVAVRAKVPIHPISMRREPDGSYVLRFEPAVEMQRSGEARQDLLVNTQRCQDIIEGIIRRQPEQWLWFHRRWKPRPRLEAEWQERLARDAKRRASRSAEQAS